MNLIKEYKQYIIGGIGGGLLVFLMMTLVTRNVTKNMKPSEIPTPLLVATPSTETPYPSQIIDLANWKLTLPIGSSEHPTEIVQPQLGTYKLKPWFVISPDGEGIQFRAPVNGVTTSGSGYPRSELREMVNDGKDKASWSSTTDIHTMFLDQAITNIPKIKKHIVAGQIHDADDDIIVIRLEYPNLYVNVGGKNVYTLDSNYTLGKRFTIKFVVNGGKTYVYYNGSDKASYVLTKNYSNAYFKTGVYTQSNCDREGTLALCNDDNFGEVIVYQATVTHE